MDIFGSITTALAVALLSISPATPEHISSAALSLTRELPSIQTLGTQINQINPKTVAQGEILATEYIAPPEPVQVEAPAPAPVAPVVPKPTPIIQISASVPSGNKNDWLVASGIGQSDWTYVDYIISRESGWNPASSNPYSGAHGLPQALPYSKTGCGWVDAVCQLKWATGYAVGRYGSWAGAYQYWLGHSYW